MKTYPDAWCKHGHAFTPANTAWTIRRRDGHRERVCRQCRKDALKRYQRSEKLKSVFPERLPLMTEPWA